MVTKPIWMFILSVSEALPALNATPVTPALGVTTPPTVCSTFAPATNGTTRSGAVPENEPGVAPTAFTAKVACETVTALRFSAPAAVTSEAGSAALNLNDAAIGAPGATELGRP